MLVKDGLFKFVDDGHAEELDHNYFVAIRSSYLTLRQGGKFIIEPYSPHRFGRQFGYYQDVPGTLNYDTRVTSLEEGLRYWRLCVLSKSSSKAPYLPTNAKKLCSEAYKAWTRTRKLKVARNNPPHALIPPVVIECDYQATVVEASKGKCSSHNMLEDEVQSIDVGEESETSHSSTMTPPLRIGFTRKQSPPPAAVSVFKVCAYGEARPLSFEKLSRSLHEQQLEEAKAHLQDIQAKESEEPLRSNDELEHIEERDEDELACYFKKQLNHDTQA
ncbi:UNVERIFIED_CONTAM: hypothetical protein Sangu_3109700 [Sesamum angustifolium]|uniref:Uncharacterized protein n=1 Tax=Sesamum angustifolium TaxID=2727405 RepID=A0AAW2K759_9LAMI